MRICLQLINKPIACLPHIICIVLVMNSTKFVTVAFSLENWWMATMIAKKHKGDFDTYFFVIDNFIKHVAGCKRIQQTCCNRCYAAK
jgi:hypothetical protein